MRSILLFPIACLLFLALASCAGMQGKATLSDAAGQQQLIREAQATLRRMRADERFTQLDQLLAHARGVIIFPRLVKVGLVYGGQTGNGVLLTRADGGELSPVALCRLERASFGAQIGVSETALVVVLMSDAALARLSHGGLESGAPLFLTAGKAGTKLDISTVDAREDVYTLADVGPSFVGVYFEGGTIRILKYLQSEYPGQL
jgi:lipid-binding SYLF domain-containing protein